MQTLNVHQMMELYGTILPLAILLVNDDEDRAFLCEVYLQYKALIYKVASDYFKHNQVEIEDAVGESVERLCKYCKNFRAIPCNKMAAYIVKLVENVCRTRLRAIMMEKNHYAFSIDEEQSEQIPTHDSVLETVFSHFYAEELLAMFDRLNEYDRELIRMRHVDQMSYAEIAKALQMNEGSVRTALSRAKHRLKKIGAGDKEENHDDAEKIRDRCGSKFAG